MTLRRLVGRGWRGKRGAGALEYALLLFLIIVVGFVAWKYLGGSVSGSTEKADTRFKGGEGSGQTAAAGGAGDDKSGGSAGGKGQTAAKPAAGGGGGNEKTGTPGGAGVATVQKPGTGGPVEVHGSGRVVAAEEAGGRKPKSWIRYFMIGLLVIGLMGAIYTFGKKKSTA